MPFPSALSSGNYTSLRSTYSARQYVALCPNNVVFQVRPSSASSTSTYAEIPYTTVESGAFGNVRVGQTVLITNSGSNLRTPLWRGRVRKAATSGVLFINETGFALNTSHYVTVIDTYDIAPRLPRVTSAGALLVDWDVPYQALAPLISGLQASYVLPTTGASASVSFAPTATAMTSGATISTWAWDVGDGTITVGTSSTQNITASFPTGHRWVRLTVTDSGGRSAYFVFEVYVGNPFSSALFYEVTEASVTADIDTGYSASITARAGVQNVLEQTRATLFSVERLGTSETPIVNNIDCIGYIRQESVTTSVNPQTLLVKSVSFDVEGFLSKLATTPISGIRLDNATSATVWGQIVNATPARAMAFLLQYNTTAANIMGVSFESDANDYVFPTLTIEANNALDAINNLADSYNARMYTAQDGQSQIRRQAVYLDDAGRNALTTVVLIEQQDILSVDIQRDQIQTIAQCLLGAARFTVANQELAIFQGRAPGVALGEGYEEAQLNGQILKQGISDGDARVEVARRTANHLAASNPADELTVTLRDGWRFIVPNGFQWYTFTIAATDNNRNIAYFSNNRFILRTLNVTATANGRRTVTATFRRETRDTQAQIVVARVPLVGDTPLPVLPVIGEYPLLGIDGRINYPNDDPAPFDLQPFNASDLAQLQPLPVEDALQQAEEAMPPALCEAITLNFASPAVKSSDITNLLYDYDLKITGDAQIGAAGATWTQTFDFTSTNGGFAPVSPANEGTYTGGVGWEDTYNPSFGSRGVWIRRNFTAATLTGVTVTFDRTIGAPGGNTPITHGIQIYNSGVTVLDAPEDVTPTPNGTDVQYIWTGTLIGDSIDLLVRVGRRIGPNADPGGSSLVKSVTITGEGTNPFTGAPPTGSTRGDAFYFGYDSGPAVAYSTGQGLLINGAQPVNYPAYSASHEYNLTLAGTGNQFTYQFVDPDADYTNNNPNPLTIVQCRGVFKGT